MKRKGSIVGMYLMIFGIVILAIAAPLITTIFGAVAPTYTSDVGWISMLILPVTVIIIILKGVSE